LIRNFKLQDRVTLMGMMFTKI